jgi:histidine triad (HIT) family protein
MIIPKVHAVTIVDLPEEEIEPIFKAVRKIDDHITTTLKADGLTIGINQGKVSGQEVSHLHIHLMPRFNGDGGGAIQSVVNKPSSEDVAQVAVRLRLNN